MGEIEGSLVHYCVECPCSYHIPRNFKSTHRNTRARSYACTCTVSYVMKVGAGAAFKCEMVGKACTTREEPIC
jgi:predicted aldo/keto reductase-like oxidoreductase